MPDNEISPFRIRPAQRDDLDTLAELEQHCFSDPWTREAFAELLAHPPFRVRCMEVDDVVVGYSVSRYGRDGWGELLNLAVAPEIRGRGLGGRLLDDFLLRGVAAEISHFLLEVRLSNDRARRLYAARGFRIWKRIPAYYNDGEDALVMVLVLPDAEDMVG